MQTQGVVVLPGEVSLRSILNISLYLASCMTSIIQDNHAPRRKNRGESCAYKLLVVLLGVGVPELFAFGLPAGMGHGIIMS